MGGRAGGGSRGGMSTWSLRGAAARNELRVMNDNQFFAFGPVRKEYAKYFDAENARRGNPVVKGSQGLEVGHMAQFNVKGGVSGYGRVGGFEGDKVVINLQGGKYSWNIPQSAITHYAKNKSTDFAQVQMKHKIIPKSKRVGIW